MGGSRLPAAACGNGRLLVTTDAEGDILGCAWPNIDSPNNITALTVQPIEKAFVEENRRMITYHRDTNIVAGQTNAGVRYVDLVIDGPGDLGQADIFVRKLTAPCPPVTVYVVPAADGRHGAQTVYWDGQAETLLAYCRQVWIAIGCERSFAAEYHCGRLGIDASAVHFLHSDSPLPGERIAFRHVDAALRIRPPKDKDCCIYTVFGHTRSAVLAALENARDRSFTSMQEAAEKRASSVLQENHLTGWSAAIDDALRRSSLVWDLLINRQTGGMIAGPDLDSGIASAPGYASVWARDTSWTVLGMLAMGQTTIAKKVLDFTFSVQSPEGIWLHRHHTDGSLGSSWGLHQLDETGIVLHATAEYFRVTRQTAIIESHWPAIVKAANFLVNSLDSQYGIPCPSVDLWEEREGLHLYTAASTVAGLRAAVLLGEQVQGDRKNLRMWANTATTVLSNAEALFWDQSENRFLASRERVAALPMDDIDRPELTATVQAAGCNPPTAIPQYPNWRDATKFETVAFHHDISAVALTVPYGILNAKNPRIVATVDAIRAHLWNNEVGGLSRYEGDTYGGGNAWPLATLWLAIYEAQRGQREEAKRLIEWVVNHSTVAGLVPEQVHRFHGTPIAAVPLSWSHGMLALAVGALKIGSETAP